MIGHTESKPILKEGFRKNLAVSRQQVIRSDDPNRAVLSIKAWMRALMFTWKEDPMTETELPSE